MPIHESAIAGCLNMFLFLITKGADLQEKNKDGMTPLELAKLHQRNNIIDYLKENMDKLF